MSTGNETLDRIQQEIQEALEREEELRNKYSRLGNNNLSNGTNGYHYGRNNFASGTSSTISSPPKSPLFSSLSNGSLSPLNGSISPVNGEHQSLANGTTSGTTNGTFSGPANGPFRGANGTLGGGTSNGVRRFTPNPAARGMMQKFLKTRGKMSASALKPQKQPMWMPEDTLEPVKISIEKGKPVRNGYVPAEQKMKKELQEFQLREDELRNERRKSQPDLMAALAAEEMETNLKPARSLAQMYNSNENLLEDHHSAPASLRPSRSLAQLCDVEDESLAVPGTHSLIMQFENLRTHNV